MEGKSRSEWEKIISATIVASPKAAVKALDIIYRNQTREEKASGFDIESNDEGFTLYDVDFLTSLVDWKQMGKEFSTKQIQALQRVMPKYHRQLFDHAVKCGMYRKEGRHWKKSVEEVVFVN